MAEVAMHLYLVEAGRSALMGMVKDYICLAALAVGIFLILWDDPFVLMGQLIFGALAFFFVGRTLYNARMLQKKMREGAGQALARDSD